MHSPVASLQLENFSSHLSKQFPHGNALLTQASALACLQPPLCKPLSGSSKTTCERQELHVLSKPGLMFSTSSLIFLCADYCLTFLERQPETPANFYGILKPHICLIYLQLPFPRASCFSCHSSFRTVCIEYELSTASLP